MRTTVRRGGILAEERQFAIGCFNFYDANSKETLQYRPPPSRSLQMILNQPQITGFRPVLPEPLRRHGVSSGTSAGGAD